MEFRTKTVLPKNELSIQPDTRISMLGSCFAEHIGQHFTDNKFCCHVNPFGVLYNPASLAQAIRLLLSDENAFSTSFFEADALWHSWLHDSSFSAQSSEQLSANITEKTISDPIRTRNLQLLMVTWGTNRTYRLKTSGQVVANCHKQPAALFSVQDLTVQEIVSEWSDTLERLFAACPSAEVVFTVSPYRYESYGLHGNQLSKATLLLAADELIRRFPDRCHYFPAYEILLDELRDYRFYADDMLHPAPVAVSYIWECLSESYFSAETKMFLADWQEIKRALEHRPFHPNSEAHAKFLCKIRQKLVQLNEKYPNLAFENEMNKLNRQIL